MHGLVDFLAASGVEIDAGPRRLKIHLACSDGRNDPLDLYYAGEFDAWQGWQNKKNFECDQVLSLIDFGQGRWLFVGVYEVISREPHPDYPDAFFYDLQLLNGQEDLIGRIITRYKRSRASYIWYRPEMELPIVEIRPEKLTIEDFPGYNAVAISHRKLRTITREKIPSWFAALANIKGVYLITDTSAGRHYVGKASGDVGIWQRWCSYAETGHGGNVHLKQLLNENGIEHADHFQFSILEIADTHASEKDILARESYWMDVLKTREHGLN